MRLSVCSLMISWTQVKPALAVGVSTKGLVDIGDASAEVGSTSCYWDITLDTAADGLSSDCSDGSLIFMGDSSSDPSRSFNR
jgi:hypothetical protein